MSNATFQFVLTGQTPLIMHADNVEASDRLRAWRKNPANKALSVAGDDRSPPWTWTTYLYISQGEIVMPQENIMAAISNAGSEVRSTGRKSFKALSQSGLVITTDFCPFKTRGKAVDVAWIKSLVGDRDATFEDHKKAVLDHDFELLVKRVNMGMSKNVRVRPIFHEWEVRGEIQAIDPQVTPEIIQQLFALAGTRAGLGDWRPGTPRRPGPYGTFSTKLSRVGKVKAA